MTRLDRFDHDGAAESDAGPLSPDQAARVLQLHRDGELDEYLSECERSVRLLPALGVLLTIAVGVVGVLALVAGLLRARG